MPPGEKTTGSLAVVRGDNGGMMLPSVLEYGDPVPWGGGEPRPPGSVACPEGLLPSRPQWVLDPRGKRACGCVGAGRGPAAVWDVGGRGAVLAGPGGLRAGGRAWGCC